MDSLEPPVTHTYRRTASGHEVKIDVRGTGSPVLISFHGGGIVAGSRTDEHMPRNMMFDWPGTWIAADYHLLTPSTGFDIAKDIDSFFDYLVGMPLDLQALFIYGGSGGGYPLRLAAVAAAKEIQSPSPRFTVLGCLSYCGMGGDFLLDYWIYPRVLGFAPDLNVTEDTLEKVAEEYRMKTQWWRESSQEFSDCSATKLTVDGHHRTEPWLYWHLAGTINDAITGDQALSAKLKTVSHDARPSVIAESYTALYPQLFFEKHGSSVPPFLLLHGDEDDVIPIEESLRTLQALKDSGGSAELVVVHGTKHSMRPEGHPEGKPTKEDEYAMDWMLKTFEKQKTR